MARSRKTGARQKGTADLGSAGRTDTGLPSAASDDSGMASDGLVRLAVALTRADGGCAAVRQEDRLTCGGYLHKGEMVPADLQVRVRRAPGNGMEALDSPDEDLLPGGLRQRLNVTAVLYAHVRDVNGRLIGLVEVHRSGGVFTVEDQENLDGLAQLAGPALQNELVRRRLREAEESLQGLSVQMSEAAVQQQELERLLALQSRVATGYVKPSVVGAEHELLDYLRRSREQLSAILQGVSEGIIVHDPSGRLLQANSAAARLLGFESPEELLGIPAGEVMGRVEIVAQPGSRLPESLLPVPSEGADGLRSAETFLSLRRMDGREERALVLRSTPVRDEDDRLRFIVTVFTDITERFQSERLREQFLSMVTHELRSPLAAIKVGVSLAEDDAPEDRARLREVLRGIDAQTDRVLGLVNNLLDMAQVEAGTFSVWPAPSALSDAVREALELLPDPLVGRMRVELAPGLPLMELDAQRIAQVLVNLLTNADKFSYLETPIELAVVLQDRQVEVHVTNQGDGIAPEQMPLLFEKFSRVDRRRPGTGLGLAISKHIVEAHGGTIWAESSPQDHTTTFRFTLPLPSPALPAP